MSEKILIVDDDIDSLKLIKLMLQRQGYAIIAAQSGAQALELVESEHPDLMLLDVMMPDMDGYEVCRRMRSRVEFAHIPIMMFTAKTLVDDKVAGYEAGADDYLTKPTHPAELASRIKLVLDRTRRQHGAAAAQRGRVVTLLAARNGVGATTVGINLGITLARLGHPAILAELRPGAGSAALQLGLDRSNVLAQLRSKPPTEISARLVEGMLVAHSSRLRLLLASHDPRETNNELSADQAEAVVSALGALGEHVLVDLGAGLDPLAERVAQLADEILVVLEPARVTLLMTQALLRSLEALGIERSRVKLVVVNHNTLAYASPATSTQGMLGQEPCVNITAAPDLAFQAAENGAAMVVLQPDSAIAEQYRYLAEQVASADGAPATGP